MIQTEYNNVVYLRIPLFILKKALVSIAHKSRNPMDRKEMTKHIRGIINDIRSNYEIEPIPEVKNVK